MRQIILASQSPRRKKLLEQIGLKIKVVPSNIDEKLNPRLKPKGQAEELSLEKVQTIAEKYTDAIIIGADTLVDINGDILGKPKNLEEARRMIKKLQGKTHTVITGFTIMDTKSKKILTDSSETTVTFRKLSDKEIKTYITKEKPLDKAGAYGVQGIGAVLVESIKGDFFTIIGLPLGTLIPALKKFGIAIL
jgi:septum formation protein